MSRRHRIPGFVWRTIHRAQNRYYDARAVLAGYCNHRPAPDSGGYSHWRCALPRHRWGRHRFNNYTWADAGRVNFDPIPVRGPTRMPAQPWNRSSTSTMRQTRQHRREKARAFAARGSRSYRWHRWYGIKSAMVIEAASLWRWIVGEAK